MMRRRKRSRSRVDSCLNDVKKAVHEAVAPNKQVLVLNVDIGAESKASQTIANAVKDMEPKLISWFEWRIAR